MRAKLDENLLARFGGGMAATRLGFWSSIALVGIGVAYALALATGTFTMKAALSESIGILAPFDRRIPSISAFHGVGVCFATLAFRSDATMGP